MSMEQQQVVNDLKKELYDLENKIKTVKDTYEKELKKLQKECTHEEYNGESDGDYHKPGYYYTCKVCKYWTNTRPSNGKINW